MSWLLFLVTSVHLQHTIAGANVAWSYSSVTMKGLLKLAFATLTVIVAVAQAEKGLEYPTDDGKDRLINLSKKNFNRFLKKFDILVVYFTIPHDPRDALQEKQWLMTKEMLELSAQITEREGIGFGVVDLENDQKLAEKLNIFEAGAIFVYKNGHKVEYDGQRSADVLVEFLLELDEEPVEVLNTRPEVAAFKRSELIKVVGYFESASANAYDEFVDAALDFQPLISFYAVFEKQLAKQVGLNELNEIAFHEPYMRKPTLIPGELPLDNAAIEQYVSDHKRSTLRKLRPMNMYEIWEDDIDNIHVVVFADEGDPEGYEFLGVVKEVAQKHNENNKLSIVWIDPDDFSLLHSYWEKTFGIDLKEPQIGVVNVTDADSVWMEGRKSRLPTVNEMDKWISDVLAGKINTEEDDDDYNLEDEDDDDDDDAESNEEGGKIQDDDDDVDDDEKDEL